MPRAANVDEYLKALPETQRATLESIRATIRTAAPAAEESIAYDMPAFRLNGRFLVSYAAFKDHYSLFPASQAVMDELGEELRPHFSGKGTLRFDEDRPIPADLVRRIVGVLVRESEARPAR